MKNDFPVGHHSDMYYPMVEGCGVILNVGQDRTNIIFGN